MIAFLEMDYLMFFKGLSGLRRQTLKKFVKVFRCVR